MGLPYLEEEELLFFIKYMLLPIISLGHLSAFAQRNEILSNLPQVTAKDMKWANEVAGKFKDAAKEEIIAKFLSLKNMQGREAEVELYNNKKDRLRIFVSSSMPISLLKAYNLEAAKYGGSLVFKGLPNGSFKELTKLVMQISKETTEGLGHLEIDDQAFEKFGINSVPAIVLSNNEGEGFLSSKNDKEEFDKVIGAVTLQLALEKFAASGDLPEVAARYLSK